MKQIVRLRALWLALGSIVLAIVLLITLAPARDIAHTALGWLRVETLEITDSAQPMAASTGGAPATPAPTLAEIVKVVSVQPSETNQDASPADIRALPFEIVSIDPPNDFSDAPERSVTTFGTLTLQLDTANLAALLAPGFPSRSLARRLGTDDVTVAGGALVVTSWSADDARQDPLTLLQIEAPLVSGLPPRDLELLAELLSQAFLPPILSPEIDVLDIPLVQAALGLEISPAASAAPTITDLPTGDQAATWMRDRTQFLLTGPLAPDRLLRLAATARTER